MNEATANANACSSSSQNDTMNCETCNNRQSRRKQLWNKRRAKNERGRIGGRRQRRLWQLPESSILEYTKWIQDKPEADRTPSEERFLWKCMIRSLGVVGTRKGGRQERIREFVDRLEQKEPMELTENEEHFVRLYHKRKQDRKAQKQHQRKQNQEEQVVSWMRNDTNTNNSNSNNNNHKKTSHKHNRKNKKHKKQKGFEPSASLESLRESMMNMGLSSDKLKQVRFADLPMK